MAPLDGADSWLQDLLLQMHHYYHPANSYDRRVNLFRRLNNNSNLLYHSAGLCRPFDTLPRPFDNKNLLILPTSSG